MSLGKLLKNGRAAEGLTRKQLSALVGANINSIAKYEQAGEVNGQFPPLPMLAKIVSVLNLSPSEVFSVVCEDDEDKQHFKTAPLRTLAPLIQGIHYLENVMGDIEINLDEARRELKSALPNRSNREQLQQDLIETFPGERNYKRTIIDRFFFGRDTTAQKNGSDQKDLSRSTKPKNNAETVEAVSTNLTKGKTDEAV